MASKEGDWKCFGPATITSQGQLTIPKPAREAAGFAPNDDIWVFADHKEGRVLLTHEPLVEEVLASSAKAAKRKRTM